jgi:ribonuclease J
MGMDRNHIAMAENGSVIELTPKTIKLGGTVPAGEVLWTAPAWATWAP